MPATMKASALANRPGRIRSTRTNVGVRVRFVEWTGKSVYHCHILPHEDMGKMQNFVIKD